MQDAPPRQHFTIQGWQTAVREALGWTHGALRHGAAGTRESSLGQCFRVV